MTPPVGVRDLQSGDETHRPGDTPTIDVPQDFLRQGGACMVSDGFRLSYTGANGRQVLRRVRPSPLGWRTRGETCLVARTGAAKRERQYRLCWITPEEIPALKT